MKLAEIEMGRDMEREKLDDKYNADLKLLNKCINQLLDFKYERTLQYEKDLLALRDKFNGLREG